MVARPRIGRDVPTSSSRLPVQVSDVISSFQDGPTPESSNHSVRAPTYTMWDFRSMHTRRDGTQLWLFGVTKIWAQMICYAAVFTQNTKKISHGQETISNNKRPRRKIGIIVSALLGCMFWLVSEGSLSLGQPLPSHVPQEANPGDTISGVLCHRGSHRVESVTDKG